jgi:hypothetical protein
MAGLEELLKNFKINYCELSGVETFADLSGKEKLDCMGLWKEEKSRMR